MLMRDGHSGRIARIARLAAVAASGLLLAVSHAVDTASKPGAATPKAVPAYRQANDVAVLTVRGVIDTITLKSLERRMKQAVADGADAVVLDINTPGGEVLPTMDICNLLKDRKDTPANVVAWVNPSAYSAGTIISLACREIVVAPNSTFGDAAPIAVSPVSGLIGLPKHERAKLEAPLITELKDSARRNHYDEKLVQAFVKLPEGIDGLWMLENTKTGERVFVDVAEYRAVFGEDPPALLSTAAPVPAPTQGFSPISPRIDEVPAPDTGVVTNDESGQPPVELDQKLPPTRAALTSADRANYRLLRQVVDNATLLTVKPNEALYYGLATAIVANDAELAAYFGTPNGVADIRRYDESWSEGMVRFLVSFPVRAVLIVIFLIALFIELAAPGMGVFGATAIIALLLLIGAPWLAGMAQWWDVLFIALGIALVAVELFILPGLGVAGIAGVILLLVGLVGTFVSGDVPLTSSQGQSELLTGLATTLTSIFAAGIGIWLISRQIHSIPVLNRIILKTELPTDRKPTGAASSGGTEGFGLLESMGAMQRSLSPGEVGVAETDLRPAGRANFNGRLVDVKSVGSYIDRGAHVRVVTVGRFVIEVEEAGT